MLKVKLIHGLLLFSDVWHFSNFFFFGGVQPSSFFLPPLFFSSLFKLLDPLPLLLGFCWPWNQFLMGTQWPRAEPTCCIQMWPPAIISRLPTLYKHSFNNLSSQLLSTCTFVPSWAAANGNCRRTLLQLQRRRPPEQKDGRKRLF